MVPYDTLTFKVSTIDHSVIYPRTMLKKDRTGGYTLRRNRTSIFSSEVRPSTVNIVMPLVPPSKMGVISLIRGSDTKIQSQ